MPCSRVLLVRVGSPARASWGSVRRVLAGRCVVPCGRAGRRGRRGYRCRSEVVASVGAGGVEFVGRSKMADHDWRRRREGRRPTLPHSVAIDLKCFGGHPDPDLDDGVVAPHLSTALGQPSDAPGDGPVDQDDRQVPRSRLPNAWVVVTNPASRSSSANILISMSVRSLSCRTADRMLVPTPSWTEPLDMCGEVVFETRATPPWRSGSRARREAAVVSSFGGGIAHRVKAGYLSTGNSQQSRR